MIGWKVTVRTMLILSLVLLPGIMSINNIYGLNATSLAIILLPSSINTGGMFSISATLSGPTHATATGMITYQVFAAGSCSGVTSQINVKNIITPGIIPSSDPFTMNFAGTFGVNAIYSGDGSNFGSTSLCRQVVVTKTSTTLSTKGSPTIPASGAPPFMITDTATLAGANFVSAGGTVIYTLYFGPSCSGAPLQSDTEPVTLGVPMASMVFTINTPGTYSLRASYSGDPNHLGSMSPCETAITVTKMVSSIITTPMPGTSVTAGTAVFDTAILSVTSNAGGTVTYTLYSNAGCTSFFGSDMKTVVNGAVPNSKTFVLNNMGTYCFIAKYNGDKNNLAATSSPEIVTVMISSPTLNTGFTTSTTITAAQTITDSATLSGATSNAGNTVTYTVYTDAGCITPPPTPVSSMVTVASGKVPSATLTIITGSNLVTTQYWVQAKYSGDSNNSPATSVTCEGPITITRATPTITTQLSATLIPPTSGSFTDLATLTGASATAGNTVDYNVYTGSFCSGTPADSDPGKAVTNGVAAPSKSFLGSLLGAGVFSVQATYSGDGNNNGPVMSPCNEFVTVALLPSAITTHLSSSSITVFGSVTDSATLTGTTTTAAGSVTYTMYKAGSCSGSIVDTSGPLTVMNAVVPSSKNWGPSDTGTVGFFSFQAVFTPTDGDNGPATSAPCETLTVNPASPTLSTILSPSTIAHGNPVTDTATLFGATSNAGGTVTFTVYNDPTCSQGYSDNIVFTDLNEPVISGVAHSKPFTPNTAGTYSYKAVYSGDPNNNAAPAACEVLTVI